MSPKNVAKLQHRYDAMVRWLQEDHPEVSQQKHLNAGSVEQAYWHYGYAIALRDVLTLLQKEDEEPGDANP